MAMAAGTPEERKAHWLRAQTVQPGRPWAWQVVQQTDGAWILGSVATIGVHEVHVARYATCIGRLCRVAGCRVLNGMLKTSHSKMPTVFRSRDGQIFKKRCSGQECHDRLQ